MEGSPRGFIISAKKVGIEDVFPRPPSHRARFNFAETNVTRLEHAQGTIQRARYVPQAECDGGFIRARKNTAPLSQKKESGEIPLVVFNASTKNASLVNRRSLFASNPSSVWDRLRRHVLHASSGVIKGCRLNLRISPKKVAALSERNRMRISPAQIRKLHSRRGDQIVHDPQAEFFLDESLAGQKKVEVLRHRTRQGILDGDYRSPNGTSLQPLKDFRGARARDDRTSRQ